MTLSKNGKKLSQNEAESIENAVKESGIGAVHPEKMEAFADMMVSKLKGAGKHWRTCNNLDD
tara:strand:- start:4214 stop:4399 length:186 start_codon:yes stop_codon:yes gene_type:complete